MNETIAAIASPPGPGLRGIIRISGSEVSNVLSRLLRQTDWKADDPQRRSTVPRRLPVQIPIGQDDLKLSAHVCFWPTHRSFTGESLAELHLIGAPPLLNEVLSRILTSGARPAERGEFTLRAFLAGRIDLVQAEAVLGVIDAGNSQELQTALAQLAGGISGRLADLREELLLHLADLEAGLDFVEEDLEFVQRDELLARLQSARSMFSELLEQNSNRMLSQSRMKVVLAGLPNAGKSTLFNQLIGRQAALVSSMAGTTRDYLSAALSVSGTFFDLVDTAGWEHARDGIEAAAAELREDQLQRANLVVWCSPPDLSSEEQRLDEALRTQCLLVNPTMLHIQTKNDLLKSADTFKAESALPVVSAEQGTGLEELLATIAARLSTIRGDAEMIGATAARCEESLQHARQGIDRAIAALVDQAGDEFISLELRDVLDHLGRIMGQVYTDDILDRIFSRFCIGK